jgi:hypothetical protein
MAVLISAPGVSEEIYMKVTLVAVVYFSAIAMVHKARQSDLPSSNFLLVVFLVGSCSDPCILSSKNSRQAFAP